MLVDEALEHGKDFVPEVQHHHAEKSPLIRKEHVPRRGLLIRRTLGEPDDSGLTAAEQHDAAEFDVVLVYGHDFLGQEPHVGGEVDRLHLRAMRARRLLLGEEDLLWDRHLKQVDTVLALRCKRSRVGKLTPARASACSLSR